MKRYPNNLKDLTWSVDVHLNLINANDAFKSRMRDASNGVIELGDSSIFFPELGKDLKKKWRGHYKKALSGVPLSLVENIYDAGTSRNEYWSIQFNPFHNYTGEVIGVACYSKNITSQKEQESELINAKTELTSNFASSANVICAIDEEGRFIRVSNASESVLGFKQEDLEGRGFNDYVHKEDQEKTQKASSEIISSENVIHFNNRYVSKNGEILPVSWSAYWDDKVRVMYCFARAEIKDKEQVEDLIEVEKKFKALIQEGSDLIGIIDATGIYSYVSPTSLTVLGIAPEEFIGKNAFDFIHPDDSEKVLRSLEKIFSENRVLVEPFRFQNNKKEWRWIETVLTNMLENPMINGIVANSRDITSKIEQEIKIKQNQKRFEFLIENSLDCVVIISPEGQISYVSGSAKNILGYTPSEMMAFNFWELCHQSGFVRSQNSLKRCLENPGVPIKCSIARIRHKNGSWRWVEPVITNFLDNPDIRGIVDNFRDVTDQIEERQKLKLLESVITNSTDAVLITEAEPFDEPGHQIIYVNDAFTKMTGYTAEEVIGKTPRILQGPKSDMVALKKFGEKIRTWQPTEITTINYKKNGEEYWSNFTAIPVANENGCYTHWFAIERDVTEQKNAEAVKELTAKVSMIFNGEMELNVTLENLCFEISQFVQLSLCEVWLKNDSGNLLELTCKYQKDDASKVFYSDNDVASFEKGTGLPGHVWQSNGLIIEQIENNYNGILVRKDFALKAGLKAIGGIPIISNNDIIGVIVFGSKNNAKNLTIISDVLLGLQKVIGSEIERKRTEIELTNFFEFAPNAKVIMDIDGKIKRANPAAIEALDYSYNELITKNFRDILHTDDLIQLNIEFEKLQLKSSIINFENRIITKLGEVKTFNWSASSSIIDKQIYAVGNDISDQVKVGQLLKDATKLARIGSWEFDLLSNTLFWDDLTYEILELDKSIHVDLNSAIDFYHEKFHETVKEAIRNCIEQGTTFDFEAIVITGKQHEVWIRTIGRAEFVHGKCVRIYGSFQDIHASAIAILELENSLNTIKDFKFSLDQSSIIVFTDKNGIITSVNENFCKISKYAKEELIGKTHRVINSKFHPKAFFEDLWSTIKSGKVWRGEIKNRAKDGSEYWVYTTIVPFLDKNNKPFQYLAIRHDITDSKKAEQEKISLHSTLENSLNEIYIFDAETLCFDYVNKGALHNLGYSDKEIKALTPLDLKPEFTLATFKELVNQLINKEKDKIIFFTHHKRKNGSIYPVEVHLQLVIEGNKKRFLAVILDISERRKAEESILLANERFEKVTEATADAIWDWDISKNKIFRGNGFEELLGLELSKLPKDNFFWNESYYLDNSTIIKESIHKALKTKSKNNWEMHYRIMHSSGSIKYVFDKGLIIRNSNGKAIRMVGALTDITYIKEHEKELLELNETLKSKLSELETAYEELEQFTYIASHDLQEPLRMISSFVEQLKRKYENQLDSKAIQYIDFSIDGARRMKQIILDLLEYSKAGKFQEGKNIIEFQDLLNDYKILRRKILTEKNVTINMMDTLTISAYKTPIIQVFNNLIDNAIKYSKEGIAPIIDIWFEESEKEWKICVKDNGIGIDEKYFQKIFIIFQRLHNRDEYDGTGIGLAIVKKHVESWNGKISLESTLNEGSKFCFTIPK